MAGPSQIVVDGVGKRFGGMPVFAGVTLDVAAQEIVAIVGPSGCGKTTLLRCINGLIPVSEGTIAIEGQAVLEPRAGVAMVFQHFGLFPWKTVFQNVGYGLKLAGVPKAELRERVPYFIDMVGLRGFEHAYPYQLSGGMQQRCGLARALAIEPRVLMMDEPFASVDAQTREVLQFELLNIWQARPTTIVFVTHSIEEAVILGDRVIVLKGRPSRVHEVVPVDLPRPRDRTVLALPRFAELREYVWHTVMDGARSASSAPQP